MQLVGVSECPIDRKPGSIRYAGVRDAYFGTPGQWRYRQHSQTGHLWLDPRPGELNVGELYADYYTHSAVEPAATPGLWQQAISAALAARLGYPAPDHVSVLAHLLSRMPSVGDAAELEMMRIPASETGRILDVGCGGGEFLRRMRKAGWDVVGVEPDLKAAARLAAQEGFPVYESLERLIQEPEWKFDVIVLNHVIEHLPDPVGVLGLLRGLLATGGRVLLTTPNASSLGARLFGEFWRGLEPPRHFNVFTPDSMRQALGYAGFGIKNIRTEVRLARGIWFFSYLARAGNREIEVSRLPARRFLKLTGYVFQLLEAGILKLLPDLGEEIFCIATPRGEGERTR